MQLLELLNQLDEAGTLGQLYAAGVVNLKAYSHREIVLCYQALLATPSYADQPSQAVLATASTCGICKSTVYAAIKEMSRQV